MAIEINNVPSATTAINDASNQQRSSEKAAVESSNSQTSSPQRGGDQVSLTPAAQQLRGLEQQIANQPVVDSQRVQATKEALSNGSFQVNADRIAGKLMSLEKALGDLG